jgi:hypothetical protein
MRKILIYYYSLKHHASAKCACRNIDNGTLSSSIIEEEEPDDDFSLLVAVL